MFNKFGQFNLTNGVDEFKVEIHAKIWNRMGWYDKMKTQAYHVIIYEIIYCSHHLSLLGVF